MNLLVPFKYNICNRSFWMDISIVYHWVIAMTTVRKTSWLVFALFASDALAQIGYPW